MLDEGINRIAQWGIAVLVGVFAVTMGIRFVAGGSDEQIATNAFVPPTESAITSVDLTATLPPGSTVTVPLNTTTTQIAASTPDTSSTTSVTTTSIPVAVAVITPSTTSTTIAPTSTTTTTSLISPTTTTSNPPPTTTTSIPPTPTTTTTVAAEPALFVDGFSGEASSDDDGWEVDLVISLGATIDGSERASITVTWRGSSTGQRIVTTGGSGTAQFTIGSFSGESVTFTIASVTPSTPGWEYMPESNTAFTTLTVPAPG